MTENIKILALRLLIDLMSIYQLNYCFSMAGICSGTCELIGQRTHRVYRTPRDSLPRDRGDSCRVIGYGEMGRT